MNGYEIYAKFRNSQGLKDSDVAKKAGIPQSTFSDWKKGKSSPKLEKLQRIASALNISTTQLMGITEDAEKSQKFDEIINTFQIAKKENRIGAFLTKKEVEYLEDFRSLDSEQQRQIVLMLAFLKDQNSKK